VFWAKYLFCRIMEDGKGGINVHKGGLEIIMIIYAAGDLEIRYYT